MKIYSIYKSTNKVNEKVYIGFDSNWPNRYHQHKHSMKRSRRHLFCRALCKYGFDNFDWEVIYQSKDKKHCLGIMEPYFIKEYNSYYRWNKKGYNMTYGGEGQRSDMIYSHSPETRKKISNSLKGNIPWCKGKKWTAEQKKKLTEINKRNKGNSDKTSKTFKLCTPKGEIIIVKNLVKWCRDNNVNHSGLYRTMPPHNKSYKGWKCERIDDK